MRECTAAPADYRFPVVVASGMFHFSVLCGGSAPHTAGMRGGRGVLPAPPRAHPHARAPSGDSALFHQTQILVIAQTTVPDHNTALRVEHEGLRVAQSRVAKPAG